MAGNGSTGKRSTQRGVSKTIVTYKTKGGKPTRILTITPRGTEQFRYIKKKKSKKSVKSVKRKADKADKYIEVVNVKGKGRMYKIQIAGQRPRFFKSKQSQRDCLHREADI